MTNLQARRKKAGLSQSQLSAEIPELKLRTLQHYEQGSLSINKAAASTVVKIANALGCNPEDIMEEE